MEGSGRSKLSFGAGQPEWDIDHAEVDHLASCISAVSQLPWRMSRRSRHRDTSGGALAAGSYTATLVSGTSAFQNSLGAGLAGVRGDERAAIETELGKNSADANAIFVNHRIWYDAVAGYTAILNQQPDNQDALKGRAAVYDQVPSTQNLADVDWSKVH